MSRPRGVPFAVEGILQVQMRRGRAYLAVAMGCFSTLAGSWRSSQ